MTKNNINLIYSDKNISLNDLLADILRLNFENIFYDGKIIDDNQ